MFIFALLVSVACLALVVSTFARMVLTGRRTRAEILSATKAIRCEYEHWNSTENNR